MSNICSVEEVLQIKPHCELAWINRMKNHLKKINLILFKSVPQCLWLILTLQRAFLMACSTTDCGFLFLVSY